MCDSSAQYDPEGDYYTNWWYKQCELIINGITMFANRKQTLENGECFSIGDLTFNIKYIITNK